MMLGYVIIELGLPTHEGGKSSLRKEWFIFGLGHKLTVSLAGISLFLTWVYDPF